MTDETPLPSPGEARTRRRRRRQWTYFAIAMVIGGVLGALVSGNDRGNGDLFLGNYTSLKLDPTLSIALAAGFFVALVPFPLWGFTQIDELQRDQNLIGFTGGFLAMLGCYPMWALLHAGGHSGPPDALGLFAVGFAAMAASFLFAKLRS